MFIRAFILLLLLVLVAGIGPALAREDRLSGAVSLSYGAHSAEENGKEVLDASHFSHQYSLVYEMEGLLASGRAGRYDLALGYEWADVSSEINGQDVAIDSPLDKILFRGELFLAPGGLPVQMRLFSNDMNSIAFSRSLQGELFVEDEDLIGSNVGTVTDVLSSQHILTGATLIVGEKNGAYRGQYRSMFTDLPRLLLDFRQYDVRDTNGVTPEHFRDRELAFVSLNKANNWFHYRVFEHTDFINAEEDYREYSYLIGTIDHTNRRQWIDLTNWIQLSADLSYTEGEKDQFAPSAETYNFNRYDMNLFSRFNLKRLRGGNYNNFSRLVTEGRVEKSLEVPFFFSGDFDRHTGWRLQLIGRSRQDTDLSSGANSEETDLFASAKLDMFRQSRYTLAPTFSAEVSEGDGFNGYALSAGAEFSSNLRYRPQYELFGAYSLTTIAGDRKAVSASNFFEHRLEGRVETDLSDRIRTGLRQVLVYGHGRLDNNLVDHISVDSQMGELASQSSSESTFQSLTSWFTDIRHTNQLSNRFELSYDHRSGPVENGSELGLLHRLTYFSIRRELTLDIENELFIGELENELGGAISPAGVDSTGELDFIHQTDLIYSPNRMSELRLGFDFEYHDFKDWTNKRYMLRQEYNYTFFTGALSRKWMRLGEELEFEHYNDFNGQKHDEYQLTLLGDFYPSRATLLGARFRYRIRDFENDEIFTTHLIAAANFLKFEASLEYSYGLRAKGENLPERKEHLWEAKVTKNF